MTVVLRQYEYFRLSHKLTIFKPIVVRPIQLNYLAKEVFSFQPTTKLLLFFSSALGGYVFPVVLMQHLLKAAKRVFGIPELRFHALAK